MNVYSELRTGTDGRLYGVRYMLTVEELRHMQAVGLIGEVSQVIGMQQAADQIVAEFERDSFVLEGGSIQ